MPIKADYHLHSYFSGDSQAPMKEMIQRAVSLGFTEMCFTEHMDISFPMSEEYPAGMFEVDTEPYLSELLKYREHFSDTIKVRFGIELGLQPDLAHQIEAYSKRYDFDFIIGSTHIVQHRDPGFPSYYEGISTEEGYRAYFQEILDSVRAFDNFDIYGHIDYVIRYSKEKDTNYCYDRYADIFDRIIESLIEKGKGIEINTGGLDKGLKEQHPCTEFLRRYRKKGGDIITVGSDAHRPADIGRHFDRAAEALKECGFNYYCTFEKRLPVYHKI